MVILENKMIKKDKILCFIEKFYFLYRKFLDLIIYNKFRNIDIFCILY